jgi:hypothetical protein
MVVEEGKLGLAFVVLSFRFSVVRIFALNKHKSKHRTIWWYQVIQIELDFRRILVVVLWKTKLQRRRYDF